MPTLSEVDFDPFATPPAAPELEAARAPLRLTVRPSGVERGPRLEEVTHDPFAKPGVLEDVAKSIPSGLAKGAIGLASIPESLSSLWAQGGDAVLDILESQLGLPEGWAADTKKYVRMGRQQSAMSGLPSNAEIRSGVESVTGPLHEPQTLPGKFAGTMAEMVPGAGRKLITMAAIPGMASEAAGQLTQGTKLEPVARVAGAVAGGVGGSALSRPSTPQAAIRGQMAHGLTDDTIEAARRLMADAEARGVQLTWPEAIEQIRPGSGLTNMQRLLESAPDSRANMSEFFARRPGQMDRAAGQAFDDITPAAPNPSEIGPAVSRAAEGAIENVRTEINAATKPYYDAASPIRLTPAEMRQARALPGFAEAQRAVRSDPQLNRYVAHLPDDSIGFLGEVKKYLDAAKKQATQPINQQGRNMQRSAGYGSDASAIKDIAVEASRRAPGNPYEIALNAQSYARENFLEPLLRGQLGELAKRDVGTRRAIAVLFPENPLPNSAQEIERVVGALASRNQYAVRNLVRAHAEGVFNDATRKLIPGDNQWGAAKWASQIAGDAQQRLNLEAAVKAMGPDGNQVWRGFEKFLQIAEATGKRERKGSLTAFNTADLKDMSTGGMAMNAAKTLTSAQKLMSGMADAVSRWQLGSNLDELARIITDPKAAPMLKAIAKRPVGNEWAVNLAGQIVRLGVIAKTHSPASNPNER